jgi:uncharacterized membrane-anchored protein
MRLQYIKMAITAVWLLVAAVIAIITGVASAAGLVVLVAVAVAPPLGMWLMWTDPTETLSESIQSGRR